MGCGASKNSAKADDSAKADAKADSAPAAELEGKPAAVSAEGLEELRKLFDTLDKDKDGNVTGQEWGKKVKEQQELLSKYFGGSTLQEIGSAFKRIDADGNKSLTWEEFVAAAGLKKDE